MKAQAQIPKANKQATSLVPTGLLQGKKAPTGMEEESRRKRQMLQRRAVNDEEVSEVPPIVHEVLRSPGQSLDPSTRAFMEPRFGPDFSQVPVYSNHMGTDAWSSDTHASSSAVPADISTKFPAEIRSAAHRARLHNDRFAHLTTQAFDLEAFTVGEDVYFSKDRWQPRTSTGSALLQHELGHIAHGEGRHGTIEGWSSSGHRTITRRALTNDTRYSEQAKMLLASTAPVPDFNRPQILQDMVSFWAGESLYRAPLGILGGAVLGAVTPPEQGTQIRRVRISGALPQAILGAGLIPTVPAEERVRGGVERPELSRTRVTQELANHGEDLPARNIARTNEYVDYGVGHANRCDLYNGLVQLGYALHIAQDRGSHGDGYTAGYVQGRPHSEIDDISLNPEGLRVAIENSRAVIDRFYNGLIELKRVALADPLSLMITQPPVVETLLAPPEATPGLWPVTPTGPEGGTTLGGINILTVRF
jgi:hypothetical protein